MPRLLALAVLGTLAGAARLTAADPLPPDLALVPASAVGFAHVRFADLWANSDLAEFRAVFARAGAKAFGTLDAKFTPAPSTLNRLTIVAFPNGRKDVPLPEAVTPAFVAHFGKPFDPAKVRADHLPGAVARAAGGKAYYLAGGDGPAVAFVGDRTLVVGEEDAVKAMLTADPTKDGPFAPALRRAATAHVVAAVNVAAALPPGGEEVPDEFRPLVAAKLLTVAFDVKRETAVDVRLTYPTADAATAAESAVRKLAKVGRVELNQARQRMEREFDGSVNAGKGPPQLERFAPAAAAAAGLAAIEFIDELLADLPVKRDGTDLTAAATLPAWATKYVALSAVAAAATLPAAQKTRAAAARAQSTNNLKQIMIALHNYHDAHDSLPPAAICNKKGKPLLSWRVAILPYLEQDNLYKQFKLDEPWDSEHNKRWSAVAIKTYIDPRAPAASVTHTYYKAFVGNVALFDPVVGTKFAQVTDGLSNTLAVAAAGDPVPWAKPDDVAFDPAKPAALADLAKPFGGLLLAGMGDGSVRAINLAGKNDPAALLKMLITKAGGEVLPEDF